MSQRYDEIRSALSRGFFVDNLSEISKLSLSLVEEGNVSHPAIPLTISAIAGFVARAWDPDWGPVTVKTADRVEKQLKPQLEALLSVVESDDETVCSALDQAAAVFGQVSLQGFDALDSERQ